MAPEPSSVEAGSLRLLVVALTFPNRIQPWLLNTTVHALRAGADVFVAATGRRGDTYQAAVDTYGLLDRTFYVEPGERRDVLRAFRCLASDSALIRTSAWRGLPNVLSGAWLPLSEPAKRLALAVVLGLPKLDVIHAHSMAMAFDFMRVAQSHRAALVYTFHGLLPAGVDGLPPARMRALFAGGAAFIVNTRFALDQLASLGCPVAKIHILPQGTNLADFPFQPSPHPGDSPLRLLSVGRLHEDKGHVFALRALAQLQREGTRFSYRIVGVGPDRARLQAQAAELGIGDSVCFSGEVDDEGLRAAYRDADVFLFPSLRDLVGKHEETQGVAMQEAQASGCLVVTTRAGGIPESVDQASAFLCPDRDHHALADAIRTIARSPERWAEWQRSGREWIVANYDIERIGARLMDLYREVIARHRSPV